MGRPARLTPLPDSVRLGDHTLRLVRNATTDIELAAAGCQADSDLDAGLIRVRSDLAPALQREAFIHELLHHAWALTALPALMADQEEVVIRSLAPWVALALLPDAGA